MLNRPGGPLISSRELMLAPEDSRPILEGRQPCEIHTFSDICAKGATAEIR